jgi:hypothetical protein
MKTKLMKSLLILGVVLLIVSSCNKDGGPQTPPCGNIEVLTDEVIVGVQFPKGNYQINVFGMPCDEVMGDTGVFKQFLLLGDNDTLPHPWRHLDGVVGAPKFEKSSGVGFRAEKID